MTRITVFFPTAGRTRVRLALHLISGDAHPKKIVLFRIKRE